MQNRVALGTTLSILALTSLAGAGVGVGSWISMSLNKIDKIK